MIKDIRDKIHITHEDIMELNFIRKPGAYVFRKYHKQGLRSQIMELLDPEYYEVLALRNWDGLSFNEIGARIGASSNAARMKHRRAVCILSRHLWDLRSGNVNRITAD